MIGLNLEMINQSMFTMNGQTYFAGSTTVAQAIQQGYFLTNNDTVKQVFLFGVGVGIVLIIVGAIVYSYLDNLRDKIIKNIKLRRQK